jgi:hypothetical protein
MNHDHQAEAIRQAMAELRRNLDANTKVVMNHAREMVDWRYHVRKYPSLALAAAAAVGYLVVPAKRQPPKAGNVAQRQLGPEAANAAPQGSLAQQLAGTAARLLISNVIPLVAREGMRLWQQRGGAQPEAQAPFSADTPASSLQP